MEQEWQEMENWKGPVNYISHHGVLKATSMMTKLWIILNNNNTGLILNDCLPKGPNSLLLLVEAAVTWRAYPRVTVWDYSKCYNSVRTMEIEAS